MRDTSQTADTRPMPMWVQYGLTGSLAVAFTVLVAQIAQGQEIVSAIEGGADEITSTVTSLIPAVVGVAALFIAISAAIRFLRRFAR